MGVQDILVMVKLCIFFVTLCVLGSAGYNISPSPAIFSALPPNEEREPRLGYPKSLRTGTPSPPPLHYGSVLHPPMELAHQDSVPVSPPVLGLVPAMPPSPSTVLPPHESAPLPEPDQGPSPSILRRSPHRRHRDVPIASPPGKIPWKSPSFPPTSPGRTPSLLPGASCNIYPLISNIL
ncbi:proline-rich receptor-like protein kinase PERK9 [Telopea speciosissima]|uniref:proline-rich receptor-like protein kinase PERK9 n=1 Tax=Telopea speciosissima TaxID=54955 RepID=UPI001CC7514B|nr:proline-rich receptor-like protein kinase PERK9 [Telopea speciosissima]